MCWLKRGEECEPREYVMMVQFATVLFPMIQAAIWYGVCMLYGVPRYRVPLWMHGPLIYTEESVYNLGIYTEYKVRASVKPRSPSGDT